MRSHWTPPTFAHELLTRALVIDTARRDPAFIEGALSALFEHTVERTPSTNPHAARTRKHAHWVDGRHYGHAVWQAQLDRGLLW